MRFRLECATDVAHVTHGVVVSGVASGLSWWVRETIAGSVILHIYAEPLTQSHIRFIADYPHPGRLQVHLMRQHNSAGKWYHNVLCTMYGVLSSVPNTRPGQCAVRVCKQWFAPTSSENEYVYVRQTAAVTAYTDAAEYLCDWIAEARRDVREIAEQYVP